MDLEQEHHLREQIFRSETAKAAREYLRPWMNKTQADILREFASCKGEEIAKLQGEMNLLLRLESKLNTDVQSGELAHSELLESFDSK